VGWWFTTRQCVTEAKMVIFEAETSLEIWKASLGGDQTTIAPATAAVRATAIQARTTSLCSMTETADTSIYAQTRYTGSFIKRSTAGSRISVMKVSRGGCRSANI
jgi:peptidoglycan hydrolase-like amidase